MMYLTIFSMPNPWVKKLNETHCETRFCASKRVSLRFRWNKTRFATFVLEQNAFRSLGFRNDAKCIAFSKCVSQSFRNKTLKNVLQLRKTRFVNSIFRNDAKDISFSNAFHNIFEIKLISQHSFLNRCGTHPFSWSVSQRFRRKRHFSKEKHCFVLFTQEIMWNALAKDTLHIFSHKINAMKRILYD